MENTYVNQKELTWKGASSAVLSLFNSSRATLNTSANRPACNSSGVYICKSVVNYLRHGNYICKSEVIYQAYIGPLVSLSGEGGDIREDFPKSGLQFRVKLCQFPVKLCQFGVKFFFSGLQFWVKLWQVWVINCVRWGLTRIEMALVPDGYW